MQTINRSRAEAIKFKLMPQGHIRAYDSRTMSGISEGHIYPPHIIAPTVCSKGDHIKLLITDEKILQSLVRCIKRART